LQVASDEVEHYLDSVDRKGDRISQFQTRIADLMGTCAHAGCFLT
jgi:phage gp16-like protein